MNRQNTNQLLRISGGICKGRSLRSFPGNRTRPTSSKVRQALFNILGSLEGESFLDLYAGTGSVGLEARSRGAESVTLVEHHRPTAELLKENAQELSLDVTVLQMEAEGFAHKSDQSWNLVFVDPPFVNEFPSVKQFEKLVAPKGWLVVQYPTKSEPDWPKAPDKIYHYGESSLAILYY